MAASRRVGGRSGRLGKAGKSARAKARKAATRRAAALRTREAAAKRKPAARRGGPGTKAAPASKRGAAKTQRVQLREIAQARSGDKGDVANIALFAPTQEMYEIFCREVTAERVKAHFGDFVRGRVDRYEAPNVLALNFVAYASLGGGGAASLRSDPLGKSYGSNLLRMTISVPTAVLKRTPRLRAPRTLPDV
jgi:hypothetical protein